jgi:hypothetical protein
MDIVEGLASFKMKEEHAISLMVIIVGPFTTLGTFGRSSHKMMVIKLDQLVPCEGTAWDERP